MGELVASCNMHVTFFSQSAVMDNAYLHMSNSPDLNQVGCLRSLVQQTDEILSADDEDAHPSTDTIDSADEDESAGSASQQITDDETVQEDTLDVVSVWVFQFLNFLSSGSFGRYRWSLKQFSRSRCWYIPDVSYW
jgi:hypothetical protein